MLDVGSSRYLRFVWGDAASFGTAAYWIAQYLLAFGTTRPRHLALGSSLAEETIACLLGGYGIPAEMALAAFLALRREGLLTSPGSIEAIEEVLRAPLSYGAEHRRYRFANQRAARVAAALKFFSRQPPLPQEPLRLRDALLQLPGVGYKTASWIVRNHTGTDEVAIVDIHLQRAGLAAGFFDSGWRLPKDYLLFERAFLLFAKAGSVPAAGLDMLIWDQMRRVHRNTPSTVHPEPGVGIPIETLFPAVPSRATPVA